MEFDDDSFAEFDTIEPEIEPKEIIEDTEIIEENVEVKLWLMSTLVVMVLLHSFSDKWIQWVVSLCCPIDAASSKLINEINKMKEELKSVSQVDEFAKYSKLERKIIKTRQELDDSKKDTSSTRLQTKAALVTFWRFLGAILMMLIMWNFGSTPLLKFKTNTLYPLGWFISLPTGIPGTLGIPFFTMSLRTVISYARK